ncbi:hypothetical protein ABZZ47_23535 [Streptomyces sp. NPDC006465]|uniref:hypothetical protein n=1 Tax=Streptomyces sp. NPDC006465 TaxID=3157174 RepID=UPI0033B2D8B3
MKPDQDPERTPSREPGAMKGRVTQVPAERSPDDRAMAGEGAADRVNENREEAEEVSRREALKGQVAPPSADSAPGDRARNGDAAAARTAGGVAPDREAAGVSSDERAKPRADRTGRAGAGDTSRETGGPAVPPTPRAADAARRDGERRDAGGALPKGGPADTEGRADARAEGGSGHDERLLPLDEHDKFSLRMRHAVGGFVDGPQASVEEADHVLEELAGRFTEAVTRRRRTLRTSWQSGGEGKATDSDTERLRLALRDYREMTERLLKL